MEGANRPKGWTAAPSAGRTRRRTLDSDQQRSGQRLVGGGRCRGQGCSRRPRSGRLQRRRSVVVPRRGASVRSAHRAWSAVYGGPKCWRLGRRDTRSSGQYAGPDATGVGRARPRCDPSGAGAEIRTRTPLRAAEFKSAASAVPPLRRRASVADATAGPLLVRARHVGRGTTPLRRRQRLVGFRRLQVERAQGRHGRRDERHHAQRQ
jgi:hypothetical protein